MKTGNLGNDRNFFKGILVGIVIILIIQPLNVESANTSPDISMVGVDDGDQFTFVVLSLVENPDFEVQESNEEAFFPKNNITVEAGDEFTITITNATPQPDSKGGYFQEINFNNSKYNIHTNHTMEGLGFITFTDWGYWQKEIGILMLDDEFGAVAVQIAQGPETISARLDLRGNTTVNNETLPGRLYYELHYEVHTGVLLYFAFIADAVTQSGERIVNYEMIMARANYTDFESPLFYSTDYDPHTLDTLPSSVIIVQTTLIAIVLFRKFHLSK